jgi:transposase
MAIKRKQTDRQPDLWIPTAGLAKSPGHPFYERLNQLLRRHGFDRWVEARCEGCYAGGGRGSIPPGVYFRMLFIGYFEGVPSNRQIEWRCQDSLSLREFLGLTLEERVPDHSSLTRIRDRLGLAIHQQVFGWVVSVLGDENLIDGKTLGIDSTPLAADASMKTIQRKDNGKSYPEYLSEIFQESDGSPPDAPTRTRKDRKRPKKLSNAEWASPTDPEAGITRMKDGSTKVAHKVEHAVDLSGHGAVTAVTVHPGHTGDPQTVRETFAEAEYNTAVATGDLVPVEEVVADKAYHSDGVLEVMEEDAQVRTYIPAPKGKRNWRGKPEERRRYRNNQDRTGRTYGKTILRKRGELVERTFQHLYDRCGRQRRTTFRGSDKVLTDCLMKASAFNLGLLLRVRFGHGTPMAMANGLKPGLFVLFSVKIGCLGLWRGLQGLAERVGKVFTGESRQAGFSTIYAAA